MSTMNLVIPKGSLYEATIKLLNAIGINLEFGSRKFMVKVNGNQLITSAFLDRPQDIPLGVVRGIYGLGFCGYDCVVEPGLEKDLVIIAELKYAKRSRKVARVVVFGKTDRLVDNEDILVITEYLNLARLIFKKARIVYSNGCTEAKVLFGGYDYGIGVTETGESLAENGLKVVATILKSPTVLIAREETPEIKLFGEMLQGALEAERQVLLKFNCNNQIKENILSWLPAIDAPTVSSLSNGSYAIETVLCKEELANQLIRLKLAGATGIVVQDFSILL